MMSSTCHLLMFLKDENPTSYVFFIRRSMYIKVMRLTDLDDFAEILRLDNIYVINLEISRSVGTRRLFLES